MYAPTRGGNRGGWDQFKWDDVRLMTYKDRECYLGASERLGYLDKGGKWRKRDWWVTEKGDGLVDEQLRKEMEQIKKEDEALMRQKLGLEPLKDTKTVLQEVRQGEQMSNQLTEYEMKELIARGGMIHHQNQGFVNGGAANTQTEEREIADRIKGLGHNERSKGNQQLLELQKQKGMQQTSVKDLEKELSTLQGVGVDDLKYMDQRKKLVMINYLKDKLEQAKKDKKEAKRQAKKEKKEKKKAKKEAKKDKKHHRRDDSRSVPRDRKHKDQDREKAYRERSRDKQRDKQPERIQERDIIQHYHRKDNEGNRDDRLRQYLSGIHKDKYEERKDNHKQRRSRSRDRDYQISKERNQRDKQYDRHRDYKRDSNREQSKREKRNRSSSNSSKSSSSSFLSD